MGHKLNPSVNSFCSNSDNSDEEYSRRIVRTIQHIKDSMLYNVAPNILTRAEQSWEMLSTEEKDEYTRRTYSLPINGLDLFIYDYICLSGSELEGSMKALYMTLITRN